MALAGLRALLSMDTAIHAPRPNAKPPKREKKARTRIARKAKPKGERDRIAAIHQYVFARERNICRCCRLRKAESMHEMVPRSRGGKVSKRNSIAVCGQLGNGPECHGKCQRNEIRVVGMIENRPDAESVLWFYPETSAAQEWLRIKAGEWIESWPIVEMEAAE